MVPRCCDDLCGPDAANKNRRDMLYRVIHQACLLQPPFFPINNTVIQIMFIFNIQNLLKDHNIF